ncbi:MAG: OmpA family protein [Muribaculaceae bacterium]|nr:OmpA family protein [Muribaculaceae bacterium]
MNKLFCNMRLVVLIIASVCCLSVTAQSINYRNIDEAINSPAIKDSKVRNAIVEYQSRLVNDLVRDYNVNMVRNGEVIAITFPADLFFEANATDVSSKANDILYKIAHFLRTPGFYHAALAMYHDNTGSPQYCKDLTDRRIKSIAEWFSIYTNCQKYISTFSFGNSNPILENNSMNNRRMNRRLVVYLIPDYLMLENAKKNQLNKRY